ncbi:MAG: GTP-binding protein [Gemmatimonadaceae bacterium]
MRTQRLPHVVVIGGFLGAGKTTAIQRFARHLTDQGIRVALITNDQGHHLVDTALLSSCGYDTREVVGGCFCCRFDALLDAASYLTSDVGPEVLVAEAVGSCTDLAATVTYPLQRLFGDRYTVAPLSVLVDPVRARRTFGLEDGDRFSPDVEYIYMKQLEEADRIVMTKCDLLSDDAINELGHTLASRYPQAQVMAVSSRDGLHMDEWFHDLLFGTQQARGTMEVDYERYASGEAELGWLNATLRATATQLFDGNAVLYELTEAVHRGLRESGLAVGHLKASLQALDGSEGGVASINSVRSDAPPELGLRLERGVQDARILVNVRAQGSPEQLKLLLEQAVATGIDRDVHWTMEEVEAFRPAAPRPTHRVPG